MVEVKDEGRGGLKVYPNMKTCDILFKKSIHGEVIMELVETLLNQYEMIDDSQSLLHELEDYMERAYEEPYYKEVLVQLADRMGKRGSRHHQYTILQALWENLYENSLAKHLALLAYRNQEFHLALSWLSQIEMDHFDPELVQMQARILYEMGDLNQALQLFRQVIKHAPQTEDAYYYLGLIMEELGDTSKSLEYWLVLLKYFPQNAKINQVRRRVLSRYAQEEIIQTKAVEEILNMQDLPPMDSGEDFLLLARLYHLLGQNEKAFHMLETSLELDSENIEAYLLLVEIGIVEDDREKIVSGLEGANRLIPEFDEAIVDLTLLAGQVGTISYAIVEKMKAYLPLIQDLDQMEVILHTLTLYYLEEKDAQGLLTLIESLADQEQVNGELLIYPYAQYYLLKEDYPRASAYLKDGIELGLNDENLVADLALVYMKQDKMLEAIDLVQKYQTGLYNSPLLEMIREELKSFVD